MINLIAYNQRSLRSILHAGRKHASAISLAMAVCKASAMPFDAVTRNRPRPRTGGVEPGTLELGAADGVALQWQLHRSK